MRADCMHVHMLIVYTEHHVLKASSDVPPESSLPPDDRLKHIDEPVGALEQESGIEGIQDVMSPARHSGNGGTGTDIHFSSRISI